MNESELPPIRHHVERAAIGHALRVDRASVFTGKAVCFEPRGQLGGVIALALYLLSGVVVSEVGLGRGS